MDHINEIAPEEVEKLVDKENVVIIDVREDDEVAQGMIENAKHIALQNIPYSKDELDKSKDYIFVCRSGGRSMTAASYMDEHGFKVSNMTGGMLEWKGEVII
ncbi:rhodanese-like domain-containing protein [Virgibacillus profundi]|uniref:Rhodanese-like domain-containing protein n=1 Tax=Virgibacillus profundi TaxID=2024555 RepID=A0A2A2I8V1_9BACI|nr:rhodanese-like domain-containing protein [Virgibacillus profundi]PAV27714.1 rhodanese-like domain-containing protein [Virgibacillus profundi]PXY51869.1 rhodanese-like domain-containing protein [Virgibacillus profundi]